MKIQLRLEFLDEIRQTVFEKFEDVIIWSVSRSDCASSIRRIERLSIGICCSRPRLRLVRKCILAVVCNKNMKFREQSLMLQFLVISRCVVNIRFYVQRNTLVSSQYSHTNKGTNLIYIHILFFILETIFLVF